MTLPVNLIMIRHGESEGNVATHLERHNNDLSKFTEDYVNTPGRYWNLTDKGVAQAQTIGAWLRDNGSHPIFTAASNRYYVSPFSRTQQTARNLGAELFGEETLWRKNRSIRERDWGEIETIPRKEFTESKYYAHNARKKEIDPLYWRPPGGESLADVADNRVRNFFDTLHRECKDMNVVAVTHGEFIRATLLTLTRADDEDYMAWERDSSTKVKNCQLVQTTRINPILLAETGKIEVSRTVTHMRRVTPVCTEGVWSAVEGEWSEINYSPVRSEDLG